MPAHESVTACMLLIHVVEQTTVVICPDSIALMVEATGLLACVCLPVGSIEEAGPHAEGLDHPKRRETFLSF